MLALLSTGTRAQLIVEKAVWTSHLELDPGTKRGFLEPQSVLQHGSQGYPVALWLNVVNTSEAPSSPQTLTVEVSYRRIVCDQAGSTLVCHLEWHMAEKTYPLLIDATEPESQGGHFRTGFRTKDTQDVEEVSIRVLDPNGNVLAGTKEAPLDIVID